MGWKPGVEPEKKPVADTAALTEAVEDDYDFSKKAEVEEAV